MADLVPTDQIEGIVGVKRHGEDHRGRAVTAEQTVYILHSQRCLDSGRDLRDCMFSRVLDRGIRAKNWVGYEDMPVTLGTVDGRLVPREVIAATPDEGNVEMLAGVFVSGWVSNHDVRRRLACAVLASHWLKDHDARVAAQALREAADDLVWVRPESCPEEGNEHCCGGVGECDRYQPSVYAVGEDWLRARAEGLER